MIFPFFCIPFLAFCRLGTALSWSSGICCGVWMLFSFNLCDHFWIYFYFCHLQNTTTTAMRSATSVSISSKYFCFTSYAFTFSLPEFNFTFLSCLPSLSFSHLGSNLLIEGYRFISKILLSLVFLTVLASSLGRGAFGFASHIHLCSASIKLFSVVARKPVKIFLFGLCFSLSIHLHVMKVLFLKLNATRMGLWDAAVVAKIASWSTVWSSLQGLFDSYSLNQYYALLKINQEYLLNLCVFWLGHEAIIYGM